MAMRYTEKDIPNIPLTEFMAALGEKPAAIQNGAMVYYAPQRDDPEPMIWVDTRTNRWYDYATDESGSIMELADLNMNHSVYNSPESYILKMMNEYELGKEMTAKAHEPIAIGLDIKKVKLIDFMKALGQEYPVSADGNLRIYNAPYDEKAAPTMVINTETNLWRDTKSGAYGSIYDLAYELTGSCNMSELNRYIAGQMQGLEKSKAEKVELPKQEPQKPGRKMRF